MSSEKIVYVTECSKCGKPMGGVTQEEFNHVASEIEDGLCFDCDPESAATTPSIFWQWEDGDCFVVAGLAFQCDGVKLYPGEFVQSRAHERARARGLSSYTYLNRIAKNRAVLGNGLEIRVCPSCDGKGMLTEFGETFACASCEGIGAIPCAIFLPAWILGLESGNE